MASLLERMMKVGTVKTSSVLSESAFFNAKDTVETELPILNIAFSGSLNGGMVSGLTILAGLSKSFKCTAGDTKLVVYKKLDKIALKNVHGQVKPNGITSFVKIETTYENFFNTLQQNPDDEYRVETNTGEITKINAAVVKEVAQMFELTFENGYKIRCADTHAFMGVDGTPLFTEDMSAGISISTRGGHLKLSSIKKVDGNIAYDINIDAPHWYVNDENGIIHHNTLLALYCMKAYFNKYPDAIALLYDSEFGVTPDYLKANGIDPQRVLHIPIEHVEQLKFDIVKRLEEIKRGDKIFIMVDSLGNLASKKEVEDAENEKSVADMSRAKAIRSLLRIITPHLTMKDLPCIVINHVYNEISGGPYVKTVIPGGCLVEGTKIRMFDGTHKPVEQIAVGEIVETLEGPKYVIDTFTPETLGEGIPECYEVEFEDGHKVVCSRTHPFLTTNGWVPAEALKADAEIVSI
jgi:hypothetical protein